MIHDAIRIALEAHAKQVDKLGRPYILHVLRVATAFTDEAEVAVAALHDVLEDTTYSVDWSLFTAEVKRAVFVITKGRGLYEEYIEIVASNPLATKVKIADLRDHLATIHELPSVERERLTPRYMKALLRLIDWP